MAQTTKIYIIEPVLNMREEPSIKSKVASQAIFSEQITVHEKEKGWLLITTPDRYSGWIEDRGYVETENAFLPSLYVSRLAAHLYSVKDTEYGPIKTLPYGSQLALIDDNETRWLTVALTDGTVCYIQRGDVSFEKVDRDNNGLAEFSRKFLGLPYTWGGRSSFGYDCSGFVQMLYSQKGVTLPRDSKDQIQDARFKAVDFEELGPTDLLFFGRSEDRVSHVGMYIGSRNFIHATVRECQPWIRISNLEEFEWSGKSESFPYRAARKFVQPK